MNKLLCKLFILFLILNFSSCIYAKELTFVQVSDIHYVLQNADVKKYLYFLKLSIAKKNPDFVVFLGDNVDTSKEENVIGFMQNIYKINMPYYIVLGNHDAYKLSGVDKETYLEIVRTFNKNQKNKKNTYYYFKPNDDIICVVLDVNSDFAPNKHGYVSDEQVEWLDKILTKYSDKLFIIFQHVPLLPPRIEYERSLLDTDKYSSMLKKHSNIIIISSGHYHQESVQKDDNGIVHISAPAFKSQPASYQLIKVIYEKDKNNAEVIVKTEKV